MSTAIRQSSQGGQQNTAAYQAYLASTVSDDAIMHDALTRYQQELANALAVNHSRAPLALINIRLRWILHRVGTLLQMLS